MSVLLAIRLTRYADEQMCCKLLQLFFPQKKGAASGALRRLAWSAQALRSATNWAMRHIIRFRVTF